MADRTAQSTFAKIFLFLGSDPTEQHKRWANELWHHSLQYDFSPDDMGIPETMESLDLFDGNEYGPQDHTR